jgi:hypothetical protein
MKKVLTSVFALILAAPAIAVDRSGYDTGRAGQIPYAAVAAPYRAPTLPSFSGGGTVPAPDGVPPSNSNTSTTPAAYSVEGCMNDLAACVENNLPNGVAGLFNSDMRNSVVNGMNLCGGSVDKCINDAKNVAGKKAYYAKNDVWIDFNSRVIQPQYYSQVLMKTGLTPNQAENTCWLLDKNVYGSSFSAISKANNVTTEYSNGVNPYNNQGGGKDNPMGAVVNTKGAVDAQRGHYARWNATSGDCEVRVAAYNKDKLVSKSWGLVGEGNGAELFGNGAPAEAWINAGGSFKCAKELFDYNLMNMTKETALWGSVGAVAAAGVGVGIGAAAGAASTVDSSRLTLNEGYCEEGDYRALVQKALKEIGKPDKVGSAGECRTAVENYKDVGTSDTKLIAANTSLTKEEVLAVDVDLAENDVIGKGTIISDDGTTLSEDLNVAGNSSPKKTGDKLTIGTKLAAGTKLATPYKVKDTSGNLVAKMKELNGKGAGAGMVKGAIIGGAIGVGVAGIATAISAYVDHNNITCRVGDGLSDLDVGLGKSGRVPTLQEFYVKWGLRLPDTVMPQQTVTECNSWNTACGSINNIGDCAMAVINYKPQGSERSTQVETACIVSGSTCVANSAVAVSHGACQ